MYALAVPTIDPYSGYHSGMADSGFFAPHELKLGARAAQSVAIDPLAERDRILATLVDRMAKKEELALSELFDMTGKRLHSFVWR